MAVLGLRHALVGGASGAVSRSRAKPAARAPHPRGRIADQVRAESGGILARSLLRVGPELTRPAGHSRRAANSAVRNEPWIAGSTSHWRLLPKLRTERQTSTSTHIRWPRRRTLSRATLDEPQLRGNRKPIVSGERLRLYGHALVALDAQGLSRKDRE